MGLDITAYTKLVERPDAPRDEDGYPEDDSVKFYENPDFPGRMDGLKADMCYGYADSFGFRAGNYGGYNTWREKLAEFAGFPRVEYTRWGQTERRCDAAAWAGKADGLPFVELVNFSDCEGTIGPVVAKKLAKDFAAHMDKANATGDEWFISRYLDWKKAFEMAADGGAVSFH